MQAQTLSNLFLALEADLEIIPVINKTDLPGAEPERRRAEVAELMGIDPGQVLEASAKEGWGIEALLAAVSGPRPASGRRPGRPAQGAHLRLVL